MMETPLIQEDILTAFIKNLPMTRQIKFRGKDIETGEWRYGDLVQRSDGTKYIVSTNPVDLELIQVDPKTVGQFIGEYDVAKKEVYEDDLIKIDGYCQEIKKVCYWRNAFCAESLWGKTRADRTHFNWANYAKINGENYTPKIIGNIHDNPELLNPNNNE